MRLLNIVLLAFLFIFSQSKAEDLESEWAFEALEKFEMLCFQTSSNPVQIKKLVQLLKYPPLPKELMSAFIGSKNISGEGYFVAWDKPKDLYILLGFGEPDSCAINAQGASIDTIKPKVIENYKLASAYTNDIGLQVSEMYVPGGKYGNKLEGKKNGLIVITYPKASTGQKSFTLAYLPPSSVVN